VFKVMGDADLGPGVSNIFDTINLTVSLPMAVSLGLTAEAPVLK
jgi:predicted lipid carrier protein YhbT